MKKKKAMSLGESKRLWEQKSSVQHLALQKHFLGGLHRQGPARNRTPELVPLVPLDLGLWVSRDRQGNGGRPRSTASIPSWLAAHSEDLSISGIGHQPCVWPMALSSLPADKPKETLGTRGEEIQWGREQQLGSSSQMFNTYPRLMLCGFLR